MSWNEPGGDRKDPWSGRDPQNQPPDLEEFFRVLQDRLRRIFGRRPGPGGGGSALGSRGIWVLVLVIVGAWLLSGWYIVDASQRGVVTRFGRYVDTMEEGLHWHVPAPIESVTLVNVSQIRSLLLGTNRTPRDGGKDSLMLTEDENLVDVQLAVQYQIKDARDYLFSLPRPETTLEEVTESVLRGVVGENKMDFVLTEGRAAVVDLVAQELQATMDKFKSGIRITSVNLQDVQPPEEVQNAFEDAIKAREDEQRLKNEAEAYAEKVVPKARGAAARLSEEADAYKQKVVAHAEGEAKRFEQLAGEYSKAPEITRKRLFIETMEQVYRGSNKVLLDVERSNPLLYLPLNELTLERGTEQGAGAGSMQPDVAAGAAVGGGATSSAPPVLRESTRGRGERGR